MSEDNGPQESDQDPFSALADEIDLESDDHDSIDSLFAESPVTTDDTEAVWDKLDGEELPQEPHPIDEPREDVVSKRAYCEDCEYFDAPPTVHCTHEGTTILEYVDSTQVRVKNCPIVAQREEVSMNTLDSQ